VETYDGKIWVGLETGFEPSVDSYLQTVLLGRFHAEGGLFRCYRYGWQTSWLLGRGTPMRIALAEGQSRLRDV
jgi:hypothetical protein